MIMGAKKIKSQKNQKGQALVEFVLFVPFLVMIYSVLMSLGNAINGSINQQKVTRGYLKYRLQNNSTVPKPSWSSGGLADTDLSQGMTMFGMWIIGWAESFEGEITPVKTCYKFNVPLGDSDNDECEKSYNRDTTQFIRVGTVLGVCGATHLKIGSGIKMLPYGDEIGLIVSQQACEIH